MRNVRVLLYNELSNPMDNDHVFLLCIFFSYSAFFCL